MGRDNNFMMDVENDMLEGYTGLPLFCFAESTKPLPQGPERYKLGEWAEWVRRELPKHDRVSWDEYVAWVCGGGGDFWTSEAARVENARFWREALGP